MSKHLFRLFASLFVASCDFLKKNDTKTTFAATSMTGET